MRALAQDERRELLEETSHHIAIGLEYLPAIARRLYHGRDLDDTFDFTWFEYAPQDVPALRGPGGPPARHPGVGLRGTRSTSARFALSSPLFCLTRGTAGGTGDPALGEGDDGPVRFLKVAAVQPACAAYDVAENADTAVSPGGPETSLDRI